MDTIIISVVDFLSLGVIATLLSIIFQLMKDKIGLSSNEAKFWILVLSLSIATGYFFIRSTVWFANFVEVLTIASTVYSLLLKKSSETNSASN